MGKLLRTEDVIALLESVPLEDRRVLAADGTVLHGRPLAPGENPFMALTPEMAAAYRRLTSPEDA